MPNKRKPIAAQIAAGDPRKIGKRKLEAQLATVIQASPGLPKCPRHLRGRARVVWNFWSKELHEMKLDNKPDAQMLEGACQNYARAVLADIMITKEGFVIKEPITVYSKETGEPEIVGWKMKTHPACAVSNNSWRALRSFASEFGLSPVSR